MFFNIFSKFKKIQVKWLEISKITIGLTINILIPTNGCPLWIKHQKYVWNIIGYKNYSIFLLNSKKPKIIAILQFTSGFLKRLVFWKLFLFLFFICHYPQEGPHYPIWMRIENLSIYFFLLLLQSHLKQRQD